MSAVVIRAFAKAVGGAALVAAAAWVTGHPEVLGAYTAVAVLVIDAAEKAIDAAVPAE